MFPHTVTIFNMYNDQVKKCVVDNVFYHKDKIVAPDGRGENYSNTHQVIFSEEALKKYKKPSEYEGEENTFTLNENDIIVKGTVEERINTFSDIENSMYEQFSIKGIHENDYALNSDINNIEVNDWY